MEKMANCSVKSVIKGNGLKAKFLRNHSMVDKRSEIRTKTPRSHMLEI